MRFSQTRIRELLLLTGICGFLFFFRLSAIGFLGPDEPRYAQVAREMLARHDWVTPILYGHTWLEKPVLLYWGEMLSYKLFGVSDWAARVPSATAATLLVFGTFLAVRRIRNAARLDAALMVASSVLILGFARAAATDMLLAAPFCLSLFAWFCWYQSAFERDGSARFARLWLILFYALNAVATLAKGPVAPALAAFILIVFCTSQRNPRALVRTLDFVGLAVFFAVAAPWYALVQLRTPEFFRIFFLQHNLERFGTNLYRHKQPFWYYIPVALVSTLPWTVWLISGLADGFSTLRSGRQRPELNSLVRTSAPSVAYPPAPAAEVASVATNSPTPAAEAAKDENNLDDEFLARGFTFEIFLFFWATIPIVFFSLSRSKLPGYILPAIPPLLILAAVAVHRRAARNEPPRWFIITIHAVLLAALAGAGCVAPRLFFHLPVSAAALMFAALAGTVIFLIVALPLLVSGWRMLHFVTLLPLILGVGFLLRDFAPAIDATQSARPVAELLEQIHQPGSLPLATFSLNRNTAFGLAFYLDRRVEPYEGLEISPAVYVLPAAIPTAAHILIAHEGSIPALRLLLSGRQIRFLGGYRPQRIEIFEVSPTP